MPIKQQLRSLFSPILNFFEAGSESYAYKPSHRTILIVMGCLFTALAGLVYSFIPWDKPGYLLPVVIFGVVGLLCLLIGFLGNDKAVAKIWGSR